MRSARVSILTTFVLASATAIASPASAQSAPSAVSPYVLSVFANAPTGLSAPDSLAVLDGDVFVGYGDGHAPDGSDGLSSQVVEYRMDGSIVHTYTVLGHNDGLKVDPYTHQLWALQNEDANPRLVIIDPESQHTQTYLFGPTPHGGGYDDIVFLACQAYLSASNPARNPNTGPAIVRAFPNQGFVNVTSALAGDASAIDLITDQTIQLNLQDPDSMTVDPLHDIVLDSQADQELIILSHVGEPDQRVLRLPLSYQAAGGQTAVETDDTAFITSSQGFILFADKGLNAVFTLKRNAFSPGTAFTAADGGPFVGALDMTSGVITPIVTGLSGPGGMIFVNTARAEQQHDDRDNHCGGDQQH